ncbi:hypothetical protein DIE07_08640 [Burkholderia sp. Bp9002]|nr:hypothetical protein DIE07_08640 [Burkholderia sp. Bp9002]
MPWDGEEKSYVFIDGGPYDPSDEIPERFNGIVPDDVIAEVISDLHQEVGDEWAPIVYDRVADWDLEFLSRLVVTSRDDPKNFLIARLDQIESTLNAVASSPAVAEILHQMAHSSIIAALEAYLADTVKYWVNIDEQALRAFVVTNKDLKGRALTLNDLFKRFDGIQEEVNLYLSEVIWHRLDKVRPMFSDAFGISIPDIGNLMKAVKVRHDIVHRAGRDVEGNIVDLSADDIRNLRGACQAFATAIEEALDTRYPRDDTKALWNEEF